MPISLPSELRRHTERYAPPTFRSTSHTASSQPPNTPSQRLSSSGLVRASKTRRRGASKSRVITISRSDCAVTFNFPVSCIGDLPLSLRASTFFLLGLQFVEQAVQALEVALPKTPVPLQPHLKLLEWRGPQRINSALSVHANVNQSGITEHPQMFGDLGLAETQAMDHVPDRAWSVTQEFDDLKTVRLGQRSQCGNHGDRICLNTTILVKTYSW